jgi:hypothetical protein
MGTINPWKDKTLVSNEIKFIIIYFTVIIWSVTYKLKSSWLVTLNGDQPALFWTLYNIKHRHTVHKITYSVDTTDNVIELPKVLKMKQLWCSIAPQILGIVFSTMANRIKATIFWPSLGLFAVLSNSTTSIKLDW